MKTSTLRRIQLLVVSLLILVLAQGFNASLSVSSFEKIYRTSLISIYRMLGHDLQRHVEGAIRFGKPLSKFLGLDNLVRSRAAQYPAVADVLVALPDGAVVHSLKPGRAGRNLSEFVPVRFSAAQARDAHFSPKPVTVGGDVYVLTPLRGKQGTWEGTIAVSFPESLLDAKLHAQVRSSLVDLAWMTGLAALVLLLGLFVFVPVGADGSISRKRVFLVLAVVLGAAQVLSSWSTVRQFSDNYRAVVLEQTRSLASILRGDVEFFLSKGIRIDRLRRIDFMFGEIVDADPEIEDIRILDADARPLYMADRQGAVDLAAPGAQARAKTAASPDYDVFMTLQATDRDTGARERKGVLRVHLSKPYMDSVIRSIVLDCATVAVLSLMLLSELIVFLSVFLGEGMRRSGAPPRDAEFGTYGVVRPIVFILLVATSLSHSFLPLYMEELYQPLLGLSHEMVVGLPISAEMLCAGLMIGVSGAWIDRRGWHEPFLAGLLLCAVGSLLSALAGGQIALILARGAFGLGYGLAWMAGQGFVINHTDSATKARGMACFVAAVYSGSICGAATGGMLAERIGYSHVFLAAMGVCLFGFVFTMLLMRGYFRRPQRTGAGWAIDFRAIRQLMCNRNVVLLLVARSIPTAVALIGFLYYFCPIYLDSYGFSQANIARVLMVFGLFMIYVAPLMSRWVDRSARKKPFIVGAGLLGGAGLASFFVLDGMVGVLAAVTLFSLSFSFASSSHVVFFLNLERTMSVGAGEAMGAYRALEKIGQVLGPIAVAAFFGLAGVEKGVAWLGVATMAATLLFALGAREPSPGRGRG